MLNNKSMYLLTYSSRDFEDIMSKYHMNEILNTLMWVQNNYSFNTNENIIDFEIRMKAV